MPTRRGDAVIPASVDEGLVRGLLDAQFPAWRDLPLTPVLPGGNDHRLFRLGEELVIRLPAAERTIPQTEKEQRWLPRLAPALPLRIPGLRGLGRASESFPAPWSVLAWCPGEPAARAVIDDRERFATDLAAFLVALRSVPTDGAPGPGEHTAYRGAPLEHGDDEVRDLLLRLDGRDRYRGEAVWADALDALDAGLPTWFHGDVSMNNLLVSEGSLDAVIDFGCAGVGDVACDTVIAWTFFDGPSREAFVSGLGVDEATWVRGRGWALWKGLILIGNDPPEQVSLGRRVLREILRGE